MTDKCVLGDLKINYVIDVFANNLKENASIYAPQLALTRDFSLRGSFPIVTVWKMRKRIPSTIYY